MLELLITVFCLWLSWKALGLVFRMSWGLTKFFVSLLFTLALPLLIGCLFFAGGLLILLPLGLIGLACGIVKACV